MYNIYAAGPEAWAKRIEEALTNESYSKRMKALENMKAEAVDEVRGMGNCGPFSAPYAVIDEFYDNYVKTTVKAMEALWAEIDAKMGE